MAALDQFFREGLTRYPEACRAVTTFEEEVKKRVRKYVDSRAEWGPLIFKSKGPVLPSGSNVGGFYLGCNLNVVLKGTDLKMSLGYWWDAPGSPFPVAGATAVEKGPDSLVKFDYEGTHPKLAAIDWYDHTYLVAPFPGDGDPAVPFDAVLSSMFKVLEAWEPE
jgi:hypothetical protein